MFTMQLQENTQEPSSHAVVKALVKFTNCLPHLNEKDTVLQIVTEALSPQHKENLLR